MLCLLFFPELSYQTDILHQVMDMLFIKHLNFVNYFSILTKPLESNFLSSKMKKMRIFRSQPVLTK